MGIEKKVKLLLENSEKREFLPERGSKTDL